MKRYDVYVAENNEEIESEEYADGDWVKFDDANNVIYELDCKIEELIKALNKIHNIVDLAT